MSLYTIYNQILNSAVSLPIPDVDTPDKSHFFFDILGSKKQSIVATPWLYQWKNNDTPWLSYSYDCGNYLLRFHNLADFNFATESSEITCNPVPQTKKETIIHLLLDQVMPHILSHRGHLVLHASAVATDQGGIAFIGSSGQGKSTLAASFYQQGFPLITDDGLVIEEANGQLMAVPSYPGLRLWEDSIKAIFQNEKLRVARVAEYTSKARVNVDNGTSKFSSNYIPLKCIYTLPEPGEEQSVNEKTEFKIDMIAPRQAFLELYHHAFHSLRLGCRTELARDFKNIGRIADTIPVFRLSYPYKLPLLSQLMKAILNHSSKV